MYQWVYTDLCSYLLPALNIIQYSEWGLHAMTFWLIHACITVLKFRISSNCDVFEVSSAQEGCIYLMKNRVKTSMLRNSITVWNSCFLCEYIAVIKAEFSASLWQSSVLYDPSEIKYADLLLNQIMIYVENSCAADFYGIHDVFFFLGYLWIESNLFEIEIACHLW